MAKPVVPQYPTYNRENYAMFLGMMIRLLPGRELAFDRVEPHPGDQWVELWVSHTGRTAYIVWGPGRYNYTVVSRPNYNPDNRPWLHALEAFCRFARAIQAV
jgi:hypothetical protein